MGSWRWTVWVVMAACCGATLGVWVDEELKLPHLEHRALLDQDGAYVMLWTPREKDVVFEVQVATRGYVGLGFSPSGGMQGADIILGWICDKGHVFLYDLHGEGNWHPVLDDSQDLKILGGYQNDTHTVLRFSRLWDTCDDWHDFHITSDTTRIIWAYGREDPPDVGRVAMHGHRGTKSLYLQEPRFSLPDFGDDVSVWNLHASNVSLPDDSDTLYWCKLFKVPPLRRKTHVIGFEPVIEARNLEHVHHMLIFECTLEDAARHYEKWLQVKGAQCYTRNMPLSWFHCTVPVVAWAVGSEGEMWPDHVGYPLGEEHGGTNYFMMEIHYDNPKLKKGVVDGSGIRLYHTEKLRQYDSGVFSVGHSVSSSHIIPPGQNWKTIGHCFSECTRQSVPEGGLKVFQGVLHAHLLGRDITLRQIRNGRELPVNFKDMFYDFNYQQSRVLKHEMTILKGDSFIIECGYDSTKTTVPTFGGLNTREEMCLVFLFYYPKAAFDECKSAPEYVNLLRTLGVSEVYENRKLLDINRKLKIDEEREKKEAAKMIEGFTSPHEPLTMSHQYQAIIAKEPAAVRNMSVYDILHSNATWQNATLLKSLQQQVIYGPHEMRCITILGRDKYVSEVQSYPEFLAIQPLKPECAVKGRSRPTEKEQARRPGPDSEAYTVEPEPFWTQTNYQKPHGKKPVAPSSGSTSGGQQDSVAGPAFLYVSLILTCLFYTHH
nr:DBH-like monooxygenase protein 1 homolog [Procambarus clarkii]